MPGHDEIGDLADPRPVSLDRSLIGSPGIDLGTVGSPPEVGAHDHAVGGADHGRDVLRCVTRPGVSVSWTEGDTAAPSAGLEVHVSAS